MVQRQVASAGAPPHRLHKSTQSTHVPGQLIIRFKPAAVRQMAANPVARSASAQLVARATPDEVAGPLDLLRDQAGLISVKPLFVTGTRPQAAASAVMTRALVHGALAQSATHSPRETLTGFQIVDLKDKKITPALLKRLRASKSVDFVEPVPNRWLCDADPKINLQWGLRAIRWFIGAHPDAAEVHVAVIDSGIDEGHPDLKDAIEEYRHDGNAARDFLGHGSHVGGTIAAVANNSIGIAGIANCRLHCWKVFNDPTPVRKLQNFNFHFYSMALAAALDSDIKVINLSVGGEDRSKAEAAAFAELKEAGVVVAAAMGNEFDEGNPKEYPAGYPGPVGVGAVDQFNKHASFSNTGAHIGLVAPGVNILSTVPRRKAADADRTDYDSWDGTSMATPYVAGAAALLYANRDKSKASGDAVIARLTSTARKLPGMRNRRFTPQYGAGLLDIEAALKNAKKKPKRS